MQSIQSSPNKSIGSKKRGVQKEIGDGEIDIVFKNLSYFVALPEKHPFTIDQKEKQVKLENYRKIHPELNGKPVMMQDIEDNAVELEVHEKIFKSSTKVYTVPDRHNRVLFQDDMIGKYPSNHKIILNNLSGICKSRECTAILGPTGAGKTSLLNVLCCRIENSKTDLLAGNITANDETYNFQNFADFGAYVYQEINLMEILTIKETLMFAATLKMGGTLADKEKRVNEVLKLLKLEKVQNSYVGGTYVRGVSASEKKRCSIAIEIINNPQVIFLDEPTSGLDSVTAYALMKLMKDYAVSANKTAIFTIHQPSSDIWHLFDRIMLMVQGNFIYQGPGGKAIIDYFDKIGFVNPQFANPADFYMSIMHAEKKVNIQNYPYLIVSCLDKQIAGPVAQEIDKHRKNGYHKVKVDIPWSIQFYENLSRQFIQSRRSPVVLWARLANIVLLALFLGAVYWDMSDGSDTSVLRLSNLYQVMATRVGFQFLCSMGLYMLASLNVILSFPLERGVFLKEQASRMYSVSSYFVAKATIEIPWQCFYCGFITIVLVFMCNLRYEDQEFVGKLMLIFYLFLKGGTAMGFFQAAFFSSPVTAIDTAPMIVVVPALFSGVLANRKDYPKWSGWLQYLSPYKYAVEAMLTNEFSVNNFPSVNPLDYYPPEFTYWESVYFLLGLIVIFYIGAAFTLYLLKSKLQ